MSYKVSRNPMKFHEILRSLNERNINELFSSLKKSSCEHSKNILLHLILGNSIFQACSLEFGDLVGVILLNENLESLNFAGEYLKLREKVNKQILQMLIYPALLLGILVIVILSLRKMNFVFSPLFFLSPLLLVFCSLFFYLYLKRLVRLFIMNYVLLLLYSNKITIRGIDAILRYFNMQMFHLFGDCSSPQDISNLLIGKNISSLSAMEEEFQINRKKVGDFISSVPQLLYGTSMVVVTVILLGVVLSIFNSQRNMLEYLI